ncbi:MAG: DinB family protein [Bacteroidota bacterium]
MITTPYVKDNELRYFISCCRTKLTKEYLRKIEDSIANLSDDDIWWRAHETNNSIGNLMLHLAGNIRQWIVRHLGAQEFERDRDKEFAERTHIPKGELLAHLRSAIMEADAVLESFPEKKLLHQYTIQKYTVTGLEAVLHVTEHCSYHTGQIVYITKLRTGKDLKFYNL